MRRASRLRWAGIGFVFAACLSACGGGGSGGDAPPPGGGGGGGGSESVTGLLPPAPAVGATLHADATSLLPLRDTSVWHYRGQFDPTNNGYRYSALVSLSTATGGFAARRFSAANDDNDNTHLSSTGGSIVQRERLDFGSGAPVDEISMTLLRSPVRQNEQITLIDRVGIVAGDVDGDRVNDTADVAAYSRVVGNETVELPEQSRTLSALRVETTMLVRFRKSTDGQYSPLTNVVENHWFAPGIGIVRRTSTFATTGTAAGPLESDERIVYWDGVTEGFGALPPKGVIASPSIFPLGRPWSARRIGDRALVASVRSGGSGFDGGLILSALDNRGAVVASRNYAELEPAGVQVPLLALGNEVGFVSLDAPTYVDPFSMHAVRLRRFDRNAAPAGDAQGVLLASVSVVDRQLAAASDGNTLWVTWVGYESATRRVALWLRGFRSDGQATGEAQLLASRSFTNSWGGLTVEAAPGRVLATWVDRSLSSATPTVHHAVVINGAAPVVRSLGTPAALFSRRFQPVVSAQRQALAWSHHFGFGGVIVTDDRLLRAVALNDDGTPRRSGAATLDDELLASPPGSSTGTMYGGVAIADGDSFIGVTAKREPLLPGYDVFAAEFIELNAWTGTAPLASSTPQSRRLRMNHVGLSTGSNATTGEPLFLLPFDDRLLLLGENSAGMTSAVIFKR